MIQAIKNMDKKVVERWQTITLIFFIGSLLVLGYIAGDLKLLNLSEYIMCLLLLYLPNLFITVVMYIQADTEQKSQYRIQLYLIAIFYTFVLFWRLSH